MYRGKCIFCASENLFTSRILTQIESATLCINVVGYVIVKAQFVKEAMSSSKFSPEGCSFCDRKHNLWVAFVTDPSFRNSSVSSLSEIKVHVDNLKKNRRSWTFHQTTTSVGLIRLPCGIATEDTQFDALWPCPLFHKESTSGIYHNL
jgi:hypothetical protein